MSKKLQTLLPILILQKPVQGLNTLKIQWIQPLALVPPPLLVPSFVAN